MRTLACSVVAFVLAVGRGVVVADERSAGPSPQQQAASQEPTAPGQPAATQLMIDRSGPAPAPAVAPFDAEQAKRHQEAWATHLGIPVELTNSIGMKLVLIPVGEFMMGSSDSPFETARACPPFPNAFTGYWDLSEIFLPEHPPHRVRLTKA